ncbi:hypothetical protein [Roseiflexus castenholzii]|uniref:hypothetical protein n=1 Tax=Roseiflexus castenholzii TaxID=120962 RepID=UPI003C7AFA7F
MSRTDWNILFALTAAGAFAAWQIIGWLDTFLAPGAGGVWLTLTVLLGGVAVRLRQRHEGASCTVRPRLRSLQVSCFGAIALGVQLLNAAETGTLLAALPFLAAPWLPAACILGGVVGLAVLSFGSDCRNAAYSGELSEDHERGTASSATPSSGAPRSGQ